MGSGLFDRFSSARRTLGRGSIRRKNDFSYGDDDANAALACASSLGSVSSGGGDTT